MTIFLAVLTLFLLAFVCMALGVLMGRRGLRGGCSTARTKGDCKKSECSCSDVKNAVDAAGSSDTSGSYKKS